ncbi:hypothetical protein AAC03nite_18250 [Alicyclobacillus acidoterrestris]|nr:hypothetical protein AAC03nite_18250 [Alicyclobacillus acidoterrestris]
MHSNRTRLWLPAYIRRRILVKLILGNMITVLIVLCVGFFSVQRGTARLLHSLMLRYHIQPVIPTQMFIQSSIQSLLIGGSIALLTGIVINFMLNRVWLRELRQIQQAAKAIATGDFTQVPARTEDEIGQLAEAINQMSHSLMQLEEQRRAFLIDVAHELRTPLTSMRGYLSGIQDGVFAPTGTTLRLFSNEVQRLQKLVESIHQLNVLEYGQPDITLKPLDLQELVDEMWMLFQHRFEEKGIHLRYDVQRDGECAESPRTGDTESSLVVQGHRDLLAQALYNLFENAWRYTSTGGSVDLLLARRTGGTDPVVVLEMTNRSPDLAKIDTSRMFDRFYRGERSRSRSTGGLGIGLAIVKQIILAHKGQVSAASEPGTFQLTVTLPG